MSIPTKTFTLRLSPELYQATLDIAQKHRLSLNSFLVENLESVVRIAEERVRFDEYAELGKDAEMCDSEYAIHAQAEVMLHDDLR